MSRSPVLLIDIDGLRPDVFSRALAAGRLPHLARLLGGADLRRGLLQPALAPAPSITFTSQASLFTGAHPSAHGIAGNQFFDRFGKHSQGTPRHYAFDVGDNLSFDDAVRVFTDGLAARCLESPTLFERLAPRPGWRSVVASHMYARGADAWLRPSLLSLARFTKGGSLFGLSASDYDRRTLENALEHLSENGFPDLLVVYFMGVDHESHAHGPQAQEAHLVESIDPLVGELWAAVTVALPPERLPFCAVFSDHGQIGVPADDRHSLRLAFPFERELGPIFDALGFDVQDKPGEDPASDAVVASNGGLALVYVCRRGRRQRHWSDPPRFERDVLRLGRGFWRAHRTGRYAPELEGTLSGVLVRNVEAGGWQAPYLALTPGGELQPLEAWFAAQPAGLYADPAHRLANLAGPMSGDLLLISDIQAGFYFASPVAGVHGGLHPEDSRATLAFGWPSASQAEWDQACATITAAIAARCQTEGGREPATADLWTGLSAWLDGQAWFS